jgi:hypothetical protein
MPKAGELFDVPAYYRIDLGSKGVINDFIKCRIVGATTILERMPGCTPDRNVAVRQHPIKRLPD